MTGAPAATLVLAREPSGSEPSGDEPVHDEPAIDTALDAYSRAVVSAVERAGPAVVSLQVGRGRTAGAGSGFVVTPEGYVLTNSHVASGARAIRVHTHAGETAEAHLVGDDPAIDLALLRLDTAALAAPDQPVAYVPIDGRLAPRVGQLAIAIGNPLGFASTVSAGVVSALGRSLRGKRNRLPDTGRAAGPLIDGVIQHTAPLNPGNSGGPLLDHAARVIGVNTAIIARSQGIGFAIAVETAAWVLGQLLHHGRVRRAVLGIGAAGRPLDRRLAYHHGVGGAAPGMERSRRGAAAAVEVQSVEPGTAAARAGLRDGDLLVRFADTPIAGIDDLHRVLRSWPAATPAALVVIRRGARIDAAITPDVH